MSWLSNFNPLESIRHLKVDEHRLVIWKKRAKWLLLLIALLFVAAQLLTRFYIWPQVEKNKASFEQVISQTLGVNLKIEKIETGWDFLWPAFKIDNIKLYQLGESESPKLSIPQVTGKLSWETLWKLEPHFHELSFADASIEIQRDSKGNWNIAGIKLDQSSAGYKFGNWLFEQDNIEVKNAKVNWLDQRFQSSQYSLEIESLELKNSWFKHAIDLNIKTPWHSNTAIIKADFRHSVFGNAGNWKDWIGRLEWQINELNLAKVNQLFESPLNIISGQLNSQGRTYIDGGALDGGSTKLAAQNLHIEWPRLGAPLKIARVDAELEQKTSGKKMSVSAPLLKWQVNEKSASKELNGISIYWDMATHIDAITHAGVKAAEIDINLVEQLAKQFPLPKDITEFIKQYQPSGMLKDLDANWHAEASKLPFNIKIPGFNASHYKLSFDFENTYLKPETKGLLSIANLTGRLYATELGGEINFDSEDTFITLPQILENDNLALDLIKGKVKWLKKDTGLEYQISKLKLKNDSANLIFDASYKAKTAKAPADLFIKAEIQEANVKNLTGYFPLGMSKTARAYLNAALKEGVIRNGQIHIHGDPLHIPFDTKFPGIFELNLPIEQVQYSPAPTADKKQGQWSDFSDVHGIVSFKGPKLQLDLKKASFESVQLTDIEGVIENIVSPTATLKINGVAKGASQELLKYYVDSPSGKGIEAISKKIEISGNAQLKINIEMPLNDTKSTKLQGEVKLDRNQAKINQKLDVQQITGDILFSEENIIGRNLKAQLLGGELLIDNANKLPWQSSSDMKVSGKVDINQLIQALNTSDSSEVKKIRAQLNGSVSYDGKLAIRAKGYQLDLGLKFDQLSSQFPAPFNKKSGQGLTGQFNLSNLSETADKATSGQLKVGKIIDAKFLSSANQKVRLGLGINAPGYIPQQGFSSTIVLDVLDVSAWQNWLDKNFPESPKQVSVNPATRSDFDIDTVSAKIKNLKLADRSFKDVAIQATHDKEQWHASIQSPVAKGLVQWKSARAGFPQGKLTARLQQLVIENTESGETLTKGVNKRIQKIPALDIQSDELIFNNKSYGKMELLASNDKNDWKIEKLFLKTADAQINATGRWILPKETKQLNAGKTELNFDLDINNAGKLLSKLGFPKTIDDGSGKLVGQINWANAPYSFDIKSLNAELSLDLIKGTILQVDPGVARLLGVLSFQGLSRIATLDIGGVLKPIVSQGTPFDRITSTGSINNGVANIKDLSMRGPQGNIRLTGRADLVQENQDIRITVVPNFNAGSASLAYTFINPIIGLSTMVGQFLIADEVSKLFQLDYLVQGTWANPQIIALDNKGKPLDEKQLKEIRDKSLLKQQTPTKK
jgi:uncharacterized protein (TIGR02099 family)